MARKTYTSTYGTSMRRLMGNQKVKDLKLEIDDSDSDRILINGKAFVMQQGSSSESCETFEFASTDVRDVRREEYQGSEALVIEATVETMYGKKTSKIILPNVKNSNEAYDTLMTFKQKNELARANKTGRGTSNGARPISNGSRPVPPSAATLANSNGVRPAPEPVAPTPVAVPVPSPAPSPVPVAPSNENVYNPGSRSVQPSPSVAMNEALRGDSGNESEPVIVKKPLHGSAEEAAMNQADPSPVVTPGSVKIPTVNSTSAPSEGTGSAILSHTNPSSAPQTAPAGSAILSHNPAPAAAPAPAPAPAPAAPAIDTASFEDKLKKIEVMHEMGVMNDDDYKSKKLELICKEKGLDKFYEKIQKVIISKSSGLLTDDDYNKQVRNIVDPCFDPGIADLDDFKENITMIPVIRMSGLISESECDKLTDALVDGTGYDDGDNNDKFILNLKKQAMLKDAEIISETDYNNEINRLKLALNPKSTDDRDALKAKLGRWPAMVEAGVITSDDFEAKRTRLISDLDAIDAGNADTLKSKIKKLMLLKECEWLSESELTGKKAEIVASISANSDEVNRMALHRVAVDGGLETQDEYDAAKAQIVADITTPVNGDMDLFKKKIELLTKIHDASIISDSEFADFKSKLLDL